MGALVHPSPDLVVSVKAIGVQVPITPALTSDGDLLVRTGHRRTLAAIVVDRDSVPVYVVANDDTTDTGEVERIIAQRDENTHRDGLTTTEDAALVEQLAGLGLSAAQIAKKASVQVLAAYEVSLTKQSWREDGANNSAGRYLRFLGTLGYNLSPVEEYAISDQTA